MNNNSHGRLFHHFIPRSMPCILLPSPMLPEQSNDHILNLSASMIRHCPLPNAPSKPTSDKAIKTDNVERESPVLESEKVQKIPSLPSPPVSPDCESSLISGDKCSENVDMNCNTVKITGRDGEGRSVDNSPIISSANSCSSENELSGDEQITEIDVDDTHSMDSTDEEVVNLQRKMSLQTKDEQSKDKDNKSSRKGKILAFGIDRILSSAGNEKDQKSPPWSPEPSTPVVSNLSSKPVTSSPDSSSKLYKDERHNPHHSSLSKLRLCTAPSSPSPVSSGGSDNHKRPSTAYSSYHHSYDPGPYHHHHLPHINSIITSASGGIHNHNSHQHHHPLSNCPECLFLRRYCGGFGRESGACSRTNNIPTSSASSANSRAANNMQFSASMANPPSLSSSFSWITNPTIYENSSLISPVAGLAGYNPHLPLPPTSFGIGPGYSTLSSIQQCNSGGTTGRRKRSWSRAVFSNLQRKGLEKRFQIQKYIAKPDRRQLAATLGLTDAQVKVWFQNRRMKWRHTKEGKVSSGTGEGSSITVPTSSSSPPVSSTTPSKGEGAIKDKKL